MGVETELVGETGPSAEMVRLVPEAFRTHGPDVAKWQHPHGKPIDWAAAKRSGAGYAFIAVTRAEASVRVIGSEAAVLAAVAHRAQRASGLRARLLPAR